MQTVLVIYNKHKQMTFWQQLALAIDCLCLCFAGDMERTGLCQYNVPYPCHADGIQDLPEDAGNYRFHDYAI